MAATGKSPGEIVADAVYTLDEIQRRLGLGRHAMREARRKGLRVARIGRRGYVRGRDIIDFISNEQS